MPYSSHFTFSFSQHQGLFDNGSALSIRRPKYCHFNFSISLFNEYSMLISFRIDWFDPLLSKGLKKVSQSEMFRDHVLAIGYANDTKQHNITTI